MRKSVSAARRIQEQGWGGRQLQVGRLGRVLPVVYTELGPKIVDCYKENVQRARWRWWWWRWWWWRDEWVRAGSAARGVVPDMRIGRKRLEEADAFTALEARLVVDGPGLAGRIRSAICTALRRRDVPAPIRRRVCVCVCVCVCFHSLFSRSDGCPTRWLAEIKRLFEWSTRHFVEEITGEPPPQKPSWTANRHVRLRLPAALADGTAADRSAQRRATSSAPTRRRMLAACCDLSTGCTARRAHSVPATLSLRES